MGSHSERAKQLVGSSSNGISLRTVAKIGITMWSASALFVSSDAIDDLIGNFGRIMQRIEDHKEEMKMRTCPKGCSCGSLADHLRRLHRDGSKQNYGEPHWATGEEAAYLTTFYPPASFWGCRWVVDCELGHTGHKLEELPEIDGDCVELYGQTRIGASLKRKSDADVVAEFRRKFRDASSLRVLDISGLALGEVPAKLFTAFPEIRFLAMDSNRLQSLPQGLFANNSKLQMLDLAAGDGPLKNNLSHLPSDLFSSLTDLRWLSLEGHQMVLDDLPEGLLTSSAQRLRRIILSGNTIRNRTIRESGGHAHALAEGLPFLSSLRNVQKWNPVGGNDPDAIAITPPWVWPNNQEALDVRWFTPVGKGHTSQPSADQRLPRGIFSEL